MTYFTQAHHMALLSVEANRQGGETDVQAVNQRLQDLHRTLLPRLRKAGIDLHANVSVTEEVCNSTTTCTTHSEVMTLSYMRSRSKAQIVENIMGRDALNSSGDIEAHRHPVIEIRLTPDSFVVELVIAPDARCDQQNIVGKISVQEHRVSLYNLLRNLGENYRLGFWQGTHLDDMHLIADQLPPAHVVSQWLDTFAAGRDWFRVGAWYQPENDALDTDQIADTIFKHIQDLYTIHEFVSWTSNNNFHKFYERAISGRR